ncbi:WG repeat-containing protein [uncultured Prevotella sp.]|uniref:WG repeat-containing protein n=1 Tax=uncultured Prevotella sp. TaxID=159272 RepID=UPI00260102AD|nr:WG repeat-containing protein [uncultured Prevotella sp.]
MEKKEILPVHQYTKILVPASSYNMQDDKRLLIPFTNGDNIGFANKEGEIVVKPQFTMYYNDCYDESDYIKVAVDDLYGFPRCGGRVATYKRPLYGLINYKGETIFEPSFYCLIPAIGNKKLYTVQNKHLVYAVLNIDGTEVVPYGKYSWIDGFDNGLARVKIGNVTNGEKDNECKWGLIDENGKEILPMEYDNIWTFYGKKRVTTRIIKGNVSQDIVLSEILGMGKVQENDNHSNNYDTNGYGTNYGEYAGSYAQDVEGYSDDVIDDAFDGDPNAYWNID